MDLLTVPSYHHHQQPTEWFHGTIKSSFQKTLAIDRKNQLLLKFVKFGAL